MVNNLTVTKLERRLEAVGCRTVSEAELLARFVELLTKWNRKINLTSLHLEPLSDEAIDRLIVEPVLASRFVTRPDSRIVDLGSGGGSPAIPFRSQLPAATLRMVESRSRKCAFLREVVRTLGLAEVSVEESRFEELIGREDLRACADLITVRAVRFDDRLLELMRFLLSPGGLVYGFTSHDSPLPAGLELVSAHALLPDASNLLILRLA